MDCTLCNTHHKIKIDVYDFIKLVNFAKLYGWKPQHDLRYISLALLDGIVDVNTGKRDNELVECLYPQESPQIAPSPKQIRKQIIKLSKAFIKFHQDTPSHFDLIIVRLHPINEIIYGVTFAFSIYKEGAPLQGLMRIDNSGLRIIQSLAQSYGWIPHGIWQKINAGLFPFTMIDRSEKYYINKWHQVSEKDTCDLTHALREAIDDITTGLRNQDFLEYHKRDQDLFKLFWSDRLKNGESVPDPAEFRQNTIYFLHKFIEFCDPAPLWIG